MTLQLTKLTLNLHHVQARRDLGDPYEMHRTLARAFASGPDDVVKSFLWRLEALSSNTLAPTVLIQSQVEPHWEHLPEGYVQTQAQRSWLPEAVFSKGISVMFRVRANPTVYRVPTSSTGDDPQASSSRGKRKRLGLWRKDDQLEWLQRQACRLGLGNTMATISHSERLRSHRRGSVMTVSAVQFDGQGIIVDPSALALGVRTGIGHARMLGLGLISVVPLQY